MDTRRDTPDMEEVDRLELRAVIERALMERPQDEFLWDLLREAA